MCAPAFTVQGAGLRRGSPVASRDRDRKQRQKATVSCCLHYSPQNLKPLAFLSFLLLLPLSTVDDGRLGSRRTFLQCPPAPAGSQHRTDLLQFPSILPDFTVGKNRKVS
jgi:hypothetical protein